MNKHHIFRADEEVTEAGGNLDLAMRNVELQIEFPINRAHGRFMVHVLAILVLRLQGAK